MNSNFKITPENKLILMCAKVKIDDDVQKNIKSIVPLITNWDDVLQMATIHRLKYLLYYHLKRICPEIVPDEIIDSLKNDYNLNAQRNLFMFGELVNILEILHLNKIDALPYKGPVLALSVYGNLAMREFDDLDIFVNMGDVSKVKRILMSIGYEPNIILNQKEEKKFIKTMRDYIFHNEEKGITLEIHWRFPSIYFSLPEKPELFNWDESKEVNLQSRPLLLASPEDMLLILSIHNAEHRWKRISLICDFTEFINSNKINWTRLVDISTKLGVNRILKVNLYLANELLSLKIPEKVFEVKADKNIKKISDLVISKMFSSNVSHIHLFYETFMSYKLRENWFYGVKDVIRGISFPGILEWKQIKLPVLLFPLYYILRPFLLIKRHIL